jgi:hypothetical protein
MFGIPEWAIGAGFAAVALFVGIGLMVRIIPPELRGGGGGGGGLASKAALGAA